jgi:hypothetical protein
MFSSLNFIHQTHTKSYFVLFFLFFILFLRQMNPLHEVTVGNGVAIKTILRGHPKSRVPHVLVVDEHGSIWRVDLAEAFTALKNRAGGDKGYHLEVKAEPAKKLFDFHAGEITAMDTSPVDHFAATGGKDGSVRCWDYVSRKEVFKITWGAKYGAKSKDAPKKLNRRKSAQDEADAMANSTAAAAAGTTEEVVANSAPASPSSISSVTTLKWAPTSVAPDGRSVFVGFSDGVVRVLWRGTVSEPESKVVKNIYLSTYAKSTLFFSAFSFFFFSFFFLFW